MLTPIVREYYRRYGERIGVDTLFLDVFKNNPYVTRLSDNSEIINLDGCYEKNFDIHPIEMYALKVFGDVDFIAGKSMELFTTRNDKKFVDNFLKSKSINSRPIMVLHFSRTWAKLKEEILDKITHWFLNMDFCVIVIGSGHQDEYFPYKIIDNNLIFVVNWDIQKVKCLMERSDIYFGCDGGVSHIASTCKNLRQVVCFGAINPEFRKPFDKDIFISITGECDDKFCAEKNKKILSNGECCGISCDKDYKCTREITFENIIDKVNELW